jgi:hypothetical protein
MKTMTVAAIAALVAVARLAIAQTTGSPKPADDEALRAAAEAHALVATMSRNAQLARDALELARARRRREEVRCADEALSRADVALRRGRDDAADMAAELVSHDLQAALSTLQRLRLRSFASHDAAVNAGRCSATEPSGPRDRTLVTVHIDPAVPRVDPACP